jgi:hypothetical protein
LAGRVDRTHVPTLAVVPSKYTGMHTTSMAGGRISQAVAEKRSFDPRSIDRSIDRYVAHVNRSLHGMHLKALARGMRMQQYSLRAYTTSVMPA